MKLRTVTGTRWPVTCADHCGARIEPGPDVKVVVDFDSRPRKTWIPEHSPDAGSWGRGASKQESKASSPPQEGSPGVSTASASSRPPDTPSFQPASTYRPPQEAVPRPPEPSGEPKAPSPVPLALLGTAGAPDASPNPSAGVPWATASLTFSAGSFESARAGLADYAQPGETCEQLRARVNRLVLEDLERSVRAMRELHERLGDSVPQRKGALAPS